MTSHTEKEKKEIYKKWWFWIIILAIVIIISFTLIMLKAFNIVKGETGELAIEIQNIYEDATVYSSAGGRTLIVELRNWHNEYTDELNNIINVIRNRIKNGELQSYEELVTLSYIESSDKEEALFIRMSYSLPDFIQNKAETKEYIVFEEYEELFDTLNQTMDGYTGLFNSIF